MNSKEELERLIKYAKINEAILITKYGYSALNDINTINQDLDRLEQLEDNIKIHKETIKMQHNQIESLQSENEELKEKHHEILKSWYELKKVIEILKKKEVDVSVLIHLIRCGNNTPKYYNEGLEKQYKLTQQEYDLLKEHFGNEN